MLCKSCCGNKMAHIDNLHFDREGIRGSYFCWNCKTIFGCHAFGLVKKAAVMFVYCGQTKDYKLKVKGLYGSDAKIFSDWYVEQYNDLL